MQSNSATVDEYLEEVPAERKACLARLRELCLAHLGGFVESMRYGMPGYARHGVVEVGFASQKHFIAFYILRTDVMEAHRDLLVGKGISLGKGCIRYSKPERIDFSVVEKMLAATLASTGPVC